jgi:hypothetical protein
MSFIDTLKSLFGFTSTKETVENIVVPVAPMMETPTNTPEPMMQAPVEEVMMSEPVVETMEAPMTEASVETMSETAMPAENQ